MKKRLLAGSTVVVAALALSLVAPSPAHANHGVDVTGCDQDPVRVGVGVFLGPDEDPTLDSCDITDTRP